MAVEEQTASSTSNENTMEKTINDESSLPSPFQRERCKVLQVIEIPETFKTADLHNIFRPYQSSLGGYRIFWTDDDKALIEFHNWSMAKRAFLENVDHPQVRVRPYEGDLPERSLERKDDSMGKDPLRPKTNATIARRIVHHALGVSKQPVTGRALEDLQSLEKARAERVSASIRSDNGNDNDEIQ
ncbi:hypothetical protein BDF22DRAFT_736162, partial [Syncephalis plumigaleata]